MQGISAAKAEIHTSTLQSVYSNESAAVTEEREAIEAQRRQLDEMRSAHPPYPYPRPSRAPAPPP